MGREKKKWVIEEYRTDKGEEMGGGRRSGGEENMILCGACALSYSAVQDILE